MSSPASQVAIAVGAAVPSLLAGRWSAPAELLECCPSEPAEAFERLVGRGVGRLEKLVKQLAEKKRDTERECPDAADADGGSGPSREQLFAAHFAGSAAVQAALFLCGWLRGCCCPRRDAAGGPLPGPGGGRRRGGGVIR